MGEIVRKILAYIPIKLHMSEKNSTFVAYLMKITYMKKVAFLLLVIVGIGFSSCDPYYVPDNFPTKLLFSYLPYKEGDTLLYTNYKTDTMKLVVKEHDEEYIRGQRNNSDHIMENACVIARLTSRNLNLTVSCACRERKIFEAKLTHQPQGSNIQLLGTYLYEQDEMSDLIFNRFVNEINLSEDQATIVRNKGLASFTDLKSVKWVYVGKRSKKK